MKPKRSPLENTATTTSQQEQKAGLANQATAQGTLGQFEGPVQQSPFYKALYNTGTEGVSNAYQNVLSNTRARAKAAGFGEQQPVTQGAESQIESQEAKQLANVGPQATIAAGDKALQAAGETAGIGASQQGTGLGYMTGVSAPLEQQYQNQMNQRNQGLWNSLFKIGQIGAAPFTAGASLAV
jgi:hypothetical protein